MNKKVVVALALALGILAYLALQPKGDIPAKVDNERPATTDIDAEQLQPAEGPASDEDAAKLVERLNTSKTISEVAVVQSVQCAESECTVELEAKGEENVQSAMASFLREHPEYGGELKVAQGENPRVTQFTFGKQRM